MGDLAGMKKKQADVKTGRMENSSLAIVALFGGALAIGCSPILMRFSEIGPVSTAAFRMMLALPVLYVWRTLSIKKIRKNSKTDNTVIVSKFNELAVFVLPSFFFAGDLALWHWSVNKTTVANATILTNFAPVFVALFGYVLFKERMSFVFFTGMILAIFGALVLIGENFTFYPDHLAGDLAALFSALFYAGYIISLARLRKLYSTIEIMYWSSLFTTILLVLTSFFIEDTFWPSTLFNIEVLLALALVSHVMGQGFIIFSLAHLPAVFGSVSLLLQPVFAGLLAWLIFDEALRTLQIIGGVGILTGIIIARSGLSSK